MVSGCGRGRDDVGSGVTEGARRGLFTGETERRGKRSASSRARQVARERHGARARRRTRARAASGTRARVVAKGERVAAAAIMVPASARVTFAHQEVHDALRGDTCPTSTSHASPSSKAPHSRGRVGFHHSQARGQGYRGGRYPLRVSSLARTRPQVTMRSRASTWSLANFPSASLALGNLRASFTPELAASWAISPGFFRLTDLHRFKEVDLVSNASGVLTRR